MPRSEEEMENLSHHLQVFDGSQPEDVSTLNNLYGGHVLTPEEIKSLTPEKVREMRKQFEISKAL